MKKNKAAVALGKMTSPKKKISSKLNGKLGGYPKGRPRKAIECPMKGRMAQCANGSCIHTSK